MTDWKRDLAPGTLLLDKNAKAYHMVIHVDVQHLPIGWEQLNITTLTHFQLGRIEVESSYFYQRWYKVLTCSLAAPSSEP